MMFECIDKVYPSVSIDTVTGAICSFNDEYGNLPLKSCVSQISGYQDGSGTPSPSNVRQLHAFSSASLGKCDNNTASLWSIDNSFNGDVEFNQRLNITGTQQTINDVEFTPNADGSFTVDGKATANTAYNITGENIPIVAGHKYYLAGGVNNNLYIDNTITSSVSSKKPYSILECSLSTSIARFRIRVVNGYDCDNVTIYPQLIDLTQMFGSTIADYIYNLEQTTTGAGVAFFKALYPDDYYPYNAGTKQLVGDTLATFTFGQSIYQGYIDWKRGVVVANYGIVDMGSLSWVLLDTSGSISRYRSDYITDMAIKAARTMPLVCEKFATNIGGGAYDDNTIYNVGDRNTVVVASSAYIDLTSFQTDMNGVMLAYELATPITIPLGGINLLTQQGQNNIYCDTGDTTVEYIKIV